MNLFEILGPVMVGPSSSHTAGAVKIGLVARKLLADLPVKAQINLHGSFAATGVGHGTDRALVAGLLGLQPDDEEIPNSFELAKEQHLDFAIGTVQLRDAHPNSVWIQVEGKHGKKLELIASSLGGGRICVDEVDGISTKFTVDYPTLIIRNRDTAGIIARVTMLLSMEQVNIASMQVCREKRGGDAVMVLQIDSTIYPRTMETLENMTDIRKVIYLNLNE